MGILWGLTQPLALSVPFPWDKSRPRGAWSPREPAYLTVAQVAALLQVSERTLYRWVATEPTLPVLRIAGTLRFPRERLLRWLAEHEQGRRRRRAIGSASAVA